MIETEIIETNLKTLENLSIIDKEIDRLQSIERKYLKLKQKISELDSE